MPAVCLRLANTFNLKNILKDALLLSADFFTDLILF